MVFINKKIFLIVFVLIGFVLFANNLYAKSSPVGADIYIQYESQRDVPLAYEISGDISLQTTPISPSCCSLSYEINGTENTLIPETSYLDLKNQLHNGINIGPFSKSEVGGNKTFDVSFILDIEGNIQTMDISVANPNFQDSEDIRKKILADDLEISGTEGFVQYNNGYNLYTPDSVQNNLYTSGTGKTILNQEVSVSDGGITKELLKNNSITSSKLNPEIINPNNLNTYGTSSSSNRYLSLYPGDAVLWKVPDMSLDLSDKKAVLCNHKSIRFYYDSGQIYTLFGDLEFNSCDYSSGEITFDSPKIKVEPSNSVVTYYFKNNQETAKLFCNSLNYSFVSKSESSSTEYNIAKKFNYFNYLPMFERGENQQTYLESITCKVKDVQEGSQR